MTGGLGLGRELEGSGESVPSVLLELSLSFGYRPQLNKVIKLSVPHLSGLILCNKSSFMS